MENKKQHWEEIYANKAMTEVSWYEPMPEVSLKCIADFDLPKDAAIIDVGGGDSFLAEFLLAQGFTNITVLDIAENAINRAKKRLGERAEEVTWIVADILDFQSEMKYDLWHDRGAIHFLTNPAQVETYRQVLSEKLKPQAYAVIAAFSDKGPSTCSGLQVKQYSIGDMQQLFSEGFICLNCRNVDHTTPSNQMQNFTVCCFQKE